MADLVADALENGRHLVVHAGTGTGKTLACLVPAISSGRRVVVATATKALQDQLAGKDLPFLAEALPVDFDWSALKGRSNYVCLQRLRELTAPAGDDAQGRLELGELAPQAITDLQRVAKWVATTSTGDVAELNFAPGDTVMR